MIVREEARRGQILYGSHAAAPTVSRRRIAGTRSDTHDDKGRAVMPFDLILLGRAAADQPARLFGSRVMELAEAFGF